MSILPSKIEEHKKLFGVNLKSIRLRKELSQLDLAVLCDYEKTTISRIENGRTNVTLSTIVTLAEALEVPVAKLFEYGTNLKNSNLH